jgi:hypothetical protein
MKYLAWSVLIFVAVGILVFVSSDELDRAGFTFSRGHIDSGAKFGIYIGMPLSEARRLLASRGLSSVDVTSKRVREPRRRCHGRTYEPDRQVEVWSDYSWRLGQICLTSTRGEVASVSWFFVPISAP